MTDNVILIGGGITTLVGLGFAAGRVIKATWAFYKVVFSAAEIINAEMIGNGGGTLLDKVGRIPEIEETIKANHDEARSQWTLLHMQDRKTNRALEEWVEEINKQQRFFERVIETLLGLQTPERQAELRRILDQLRRLP